MKPDISVEVMPSETIHPYILKVHENNIRKDYLPYKAGYGGLCVVVGGAGSGKTSILYTMVSKMYNHVYDYIIVYCPTKDSEYAFQSLEHMTIKDDDHLNMKHNTEVHCYHEYNPQTFEKFCKEIEDANMERKHKGKRPLLCLVIFDDSVGLGIDNKHNSNNAFNRLVLTRRHIPIDIIFVSQRYTDLSLSIRSTNPTSIILTQHLGKSDLEKVAIEHASFGKMTPELFIKLYDKTKYYGYGKNNNDKYQFFQINYTKPANERFSYGFDKDIVLKD